MPSNKVKAIVIGGEPMDPKIIRCKLSVEKELSKRLPCLSANSPTVINAQVGSGKTHAIIHTLLPWAISTNKRILYVSSRVANNTQLKKEIITKTGEADFLKELTEYGLQQHIDFNGISVMTYHSLYYTMLYSPADLQTYDFLVFDEIHALFEDALFVPYTSYVLSHLREHFGAKIRLYLSATINDILPLLAKAEAPCQLTVLKFSSNYSYVNPKFFSEEGALIRKINEDSSQQKWLIFTSSIQHGERIAAQLTCDYCILNSKSRTANHEMWSAMLNEKSFDSKVAIATAVVDVGVSFIDPKLKNIVVFTTNLTTLVQVLGRKRRSETESVNLFVWCPTKQTIYNSIRNTKNLLDAFSLYRSNYNQFVERHILHPDKLDLRKFARVGWDGKVYLNSLAQSHLTNSLTFCQKLLDNAKKGDLSFDKIVLRHLRLTNIDRNKCWLDESPSNTLDTLLSTASGMEMSKDSFGEFADHFRDLYVKIYGSGKGGIDRKDRRWHEDKISKKLLELGALYRLDVDRFNNTYSLVKTDQGNSLDQGGELDD